MRIPVHYVSTRGGAPAADFTDALTAGLARDGGLYVPQDYPELDHTTIASFAGQPYTSVAEKVVGTFVRESFDAPMLRRMIDDAYRSFRHPAVTPLVQLAPNLFVLELFHGPTLAFKDVAMQLLGRMMREVLRRRVWF